MIHIVLADDHAIVREGFRALIEREPDMVIVAECVDATEVGRVLATMRVDVLVLDISMRGGSGLAALPDLRTRYPRVRVLVLSMHEGDAYVSEAFARGALGYVTKAVAPEELIAGIRAVAGGQADYRSGDLVSRRRACAGVPLDVLTPREREVFVGLAGGEVPKQVAARLGIAPKTVHVHRANLHSKLGTRSDREFYRIALEHGVLDAVVAADTGPAKPPG